MTDELPNNEQCEHDWKWVDSEDGSLASGGCYDVYKCRKCGKIDYVQVAD